MDTITSNCSEFLELMASVEEAKGNARKIAESHRPLILNERYYTSEEVCKVLHLSKRTLQNYRDGHILPYTSIGDKILYRESDIQRILEENYND